MANFVLFLHLLGMVVLLGTGTSIAFFMLKAHASRDVDMIAHVASGAVKADAWLIAPAIALLLVTRLALEGIVGVPLSDSSMILALGLCLFIVLDLVPVVSLQIRMRNIARVDRDTGQALERRYFLMFRLWTIVGGGGLVGALALLWIVIFKPFVF